MVQFLEEGSRSLRSSLSRTASAANDRCAPLVKLREYVPFLLELRAFAIARVCGVVEQLLSARSVPALCFIRSRRAAYASAGLSVLACK